MANHRYATPEHGTMADQALADASHTDIPYVRLGWLALVRANSARKPMAKSALSLRVVRKCVARQLFATAHSSVPSHVTIAPARATRPAWIMGETSISAGVALLFVVGQNNVFLIGVDDEHRQQSGTLGCAGICTDFVTVAWGL
jgi:hypothetical protein